MKLLFISILLLGSILFAQEQNEDDIALHDAIGIDLDKNFKAYFMQWSCTLDKKTLTIIFKNPTTLYNNHILEKFYPKYIHTILIYKKYIKNIIIQSKNNNKLEAYIQGLVNKEIFDNEQFLDKITTKLASKDNSIKFTIILKPTIAELEEIKEKKEDEYIPKIYIDDSFIKSKLQKIDDKIIKKKITLKDYITDALVSNPTINEKYEYIQSLKIDIYKAKAAFKPTIDLNYAHTYYRKSMNNSGSPYNNRSVSQDLTIRYNLFNGFKDQNNLDIKYEYYKTNQYTQKQVEDETIFSIVDAYLTLQKTLYLYDLSRKNYMDYMEFASKAEIQFQNGAISLKNYSKIQARVVTRYVNFEEDTKRYSDAITQIQKYIDFDDSFIEDLKGLNPQSKYFDNLLLAFKDAKIYSPYIKEAQNNVILYKKKLLNTKHIFLPTIDLVAKKNANFNYYRDNQGMSKTDEESIVLSGKINLYNGEADISEYKMKLHDYRSKLYKRDAVIKDTMYNVDMDFNKLVLQEAKQSFYKELVDKRTQEYLAAKYDFKFTKIDANGLLDELDSLYNAQRQFAENEFDIISTKYKILKDIGVIKQNILNDEL